MAAKATLKEGALRRLVEHMNTGVKPTGEHRSTLLQVLDISPADLDGDDLWPRRGFYVKISDSLHSTYASLDDNDVDMVLSNKLHLGQFMYVDRLVPASPVPVLCGVRPLVGRYGLVGNPTDLSLEDMSSSRRGVWDDNYAVAKQLSESCGEVVRSSRDIMHRMEVLVAEKAANSGMLCDRGMLSTSAQREGDVFSEKLSEIVEEALQKGMEAYMVALEALHVASSVEKIVGIVRNVSDLSSSAKTENPDPSVESFIDIHQKLSQVASDIEICNKSVSVDKNNDSSLPDSNINTFSKRCLSSPTFISRVPSNSGYSSNITGYKGNAVKYEMTKKMSESISRDVGKETKQSSKTDSSSSKSGRMSISQFLPTIKVRSSKANSTSKRRTSDTVLPPTYLSKNRISPEIPSCNIKAMELPEIGHRSDNLQCKPTSFLSGIVTIANEVKVEFENWFVKFLEAVFDVNSCNFKGAIDSGKGKVDRVRLSRWIFNRHILLNRILQWLDDSDNCCWTNTDAIDVIKKFKHQLMKN